jgi:hypothetical protein
MEGLKNLDMKETIEQFTTGKAAFDIITDGEGHPIVEESAIKALRYDEATNLYSEVAPEDYSDLEGQATYYFAINGIDTGGTAYDALIQMNATTYRPESSNTLNKYPMPDAIKLDGMANGLLFSNGQSDTDTMDDYALTIFLQWGEEYAENSYYTSSSYIAAQNSYQAAYLEWLNACEIAEIDGTDPGSAPVGPSAFEAADYPDYCDPATVKAKITKSMKISIAQEGKKATNINNTNQIEYQINYECDWPADSSLERLQEYPVSIKDYENPVENIYLFYRPSAFVNSNFDVVEVNNITPEYAVNFYAADQIQVGPTILPKLTIKKQESDNVSVFTNIDKTSMNVILLVDGFNKTSELNQGIVKAEAKDRIYEVIVQLYHYVDTTNIADKYKEEIYTLTSTREE